MKVSIIYKILSTFFLINLINGFELSQDITDLILLRSSSQILTVISRISFFGSLMGFSLVNICQECFEVVENEAVLEQMRLVDRKNKAQERGDYEYLRMLEEEKRLQIEEDISDEDVDYDEFDKLDMEEDAGAADVDPEEARRAHTSLETAPEKMLAERPFEIYLVNSSACWKKVIRYGSGWIGVGTVVAWVYMMQ